LDILYDLSNILPMALLWVSSQLHKKKLGKETETQIHAGNSTINNDYSSLPLIQVTRLSEVCTIEH
jgi:hypothetical protein